MTDPDSNSPIPEPDPDDATGPGEQPPAIPDVHAAAAADVEGDAVAASDPQPGAESDVGWDLPESDQAYVMASLTRLSGDHAEIATRLRAVEDRVEDLSVGVDGIEDAAAAAATTDRTEGAEPAISPGSDPEIGSANDTHGVDAEGHHEGVDMAELVAWVRDHVALLLERKLPQTGTPPHWCRRWWMHAEAIARFEALRRGWVEAVSGEGNAMVVWFEHLDLMLAVLMGEGGTFSGCTGGEHREGAVRTLGHDEPDVTYFADFDLLDTG